jgi:NitT/TauT family transport system permease protein
VPRFARSLIGLGVFFALWEGASRSGLVSQVLLPPPSVVLARLTELLGRPDFQRDMVASGLAWAIALLIAIGVAVPAGLILGSVPLLRAATRAIIEFLRPIPSVALIPLAIVALGGGPDTKIALAVYAAVWPILFNTIYAMAEIDPLLVDTARTFGFRRPRILLTVALPHAAPFVFTGIRLASSIALILIVSTEFLAGARLGIGTFILDASSGAGRMDLVLAGTVVAGIFGYLVNDGLERLGHQLFRWPR